jgi:hypothetical protein
VEKISFAIRRDSEFACRFSIILMTLEQVKEGINSEQTIWMI